MRLSNIRNIGRYKNNINGKEYNIKKGTNKQRGTDIIFYLYRNKRIIISDLEFYDNHTKINMTDYE